MNKVTPLDEEYHFDGRVIISQTDENGTITFVNRMFCQISGYTIDELVEKPHSIIRHPDMPKEPFKQMWKTIKGGQTWNGLIKNMRKDGRYYWVDTEILPIYTNNKITGYIAARKPASKKNIQETEKLYKKILTLETEELYGKMLELEAKGN